MRCSAAAQSYALRTGTTSRVLAKSAGLAGSGCEREGPRRAGGQGWTGWDAHTAAGQHGALAARSCWPARLTSWPAGTGQGRLRHKRPACSGSDLRLPAKPPRRPSCPALCSVRQRHSPSPPPWARCGHRSATHTYYQGGPAPDPPPPGPPSSPPPLLTCIQCLCAVKPALTATRAGSRLRASSCSARLVPADRWRRGDGKMARQCGARGGEAGNQRGPRIDLLTRRGVWLHPGWARGRGTPGAVTRRVASRLLWSRARQLPGWSQQTHPSVAPPQRRCGRCAAPAPAGGSRCLPAPHPGPLPSSPPADGCRGRGQQQCCQQRWPACCRACPCWQPAVLLQQRDASGRARPVPRRMPGAAPGRQRGAPPAQNPHAGVQPAATWVAVPRLDGLGCTGEPRASWERE